MIQQPSESTENSYSRLPLYLTVRYSEGFALTKDELHEQGWITRLGWFKLNNWLQLALDGQSILTVTDKSVGISMTFEDSPDNPTKILGIKALTMKQLPDYGWSLDLVTTLKQTLPTVKLLDASGKVLTLSSKRESCT